MLKIMVDKLGVLYYNQVVQIREREKNMKRIIIIAIVLLAIIGLNSVKGFMNGYQLQHLNQIEVDRCTNAMASNPSLICD